jgi:ATP cone domain
VLEAASLPPSPTWIYKRDGRLVPFDPDKISQALFAATETLGRPDAFLARELTDGVLHFLTQDDGAAVPTTAQVRELVAKVVRELGQPGLAQAFTTWTRPRTTQRGGGEERRDITFTFSPTDAPTAVVRNCLREYSLHAVFSRDLIAAQQDGLLTLTGLEHPLQLGACVVGSPELVEQAGAAGERRGLAETLAAAHLLCVDSPEYALATGGGADGFADRLRAARRPTIINLACGIPPAWARDHPAGPLFADQRRPIAAEDLAGLADALLEQLTAPDRAGVCRIDWHLGERDFAPPAPARHDPRLLRLARWAVETPGLTLVFDRPRRPIALGEGLDRKHPAVLLAVGLHLPRLVELPGVEGRSPAFLQKLSSLARLALSAAVQKRSFLRRQGKEADGAPVLGQGFLLDRARLVVVPVGLDAAVRRLAGCGLGEGKPALDLGRQIVQRLREVLHQDGRRSNLDSCIDGMTAFALDGADATAALVAGLTPWAPELPARNQLRAAGALHAAAEGGTAAVFLPEDMRRRPEEVADLLSHAWRQTEVVRLRFVSPVRPQQPTLLPS